MEFINSLLVSFFAANYMRFWTFRKHWAELQKNMNAEENYALMELQNLAQEYMKKPKEIVEVITNS